MSGFFIALCFVSLVALIAWLCLIVAKGHDQASILCECIADMLNADANERQRMIAEQTRLELQSRGMWSS